MFWETKNHKETQFGNLFHLHAIDMKAPQLLEIDRDLVLTYGHQRSSQILNIGQVLRFAFQLHKLLH